MRFESGCAVSRRDQPRHRCEQHIEHRELDLAAAPAGCPYGKRFLDTEGEVGTRQEIRVDRSSKAHLAGFVAGDAREAAEEYHAAVEGHVIPPGP